MFVGGNCLLECWGRRGMKRKLNKYCEVLLCTTVTMGHWHILKTLKKVFPGQFFKAKIFPKHVCSFWNFFFYFPSTIEKLTYSQFNIWWENRMSLGTWFNVWMLFEKEQCFMKIRSFSQFVFLLKRAETYIRGPGPKPFTKINMNLSKYTSTWTDYILSCVWEELNNKNKFNSRW